MTTAVERLEELLNQQESEVEQLKEKLRQYEYTEAWRWTRHRASDEAESLPLPRLEIRWSPADDLRRSWVAVYALVYRHMLGYVFAIPISETRSNGHQTPPVHNGVVELPFRDGHHIRHDMREMKLPGFAICEGTVNELSPMEAK